MTTAAAAHYLFVRLPFPSAFEFGWFFNTSYFTHTVLTTLLNNLISHTLMDMRTDSTAVPHAGLSEKPKKPGQVSVSGGPYCKVGGQQDWRPARLKTRKASSD